MRPTLYALTAGGAALVFAGFAGGRPDDDSNRRSSLQGLCVIIGLSLAAYAVLMLIASAVFAQAVTPAATYAIDFRPLFDQVIMPALSTIVLGVGVPWITYKLSVLLHIKANSQLSADVLGAVTNAAKFAVNQAQAEGDAHLVGTTHDQLVADATRYLNTNVPAKMAALGLTPEHIDNLVRSALPAPEVVVASQKQGNVTPPPPPKTE